MHGDHPSPNNNNIRVVVRVRPLNEREQQRGCQTCIIIHEEERTGRTVAMERGINDATTSTTPQKTPTTATPPKTNPVLVEQDSNNLDLSSPTHPDESTTKPSKIPRPATRRQSRIPTRKSPTCSNGRLQAAGVENDQDEKQQQTPSSASRKTIRAARRLSIHNRSFELDAVFGPDSGQAAVYRGAIGSSIRQRVMQDGYNTTVIAYGQTGSGKTFTNAGIIDAAIQDLFVGKANQEKEKWKVNISLTCVELCLEEFRDLLIDDEQVGSAQNQNLQLRGDGGETVYVEGATTVWVETPEDAHAWVQQAAAVRATSATLLNEQSSRSHAVYTFYIHMERREEESNMTTSLTAKLTLVDLAGSERIKQTGVVGSQQKESININKDLFVLGKVMSLLSERSQQQQQATIHIPYRDSKLTRLLRDSLGGNCRTVLIACVSPAEMHVEESLNTLRYAERARSITNAVQRNVTSSCASLSAEESAQLRAENQSLQRQVQELRQQVLELTKENNNSDINLSSFDTPNRRLMGLQEKLARATQEAQVARANSLSVMEAADRWRTRLDEEKASKTIDAEGLLRKEVGADSELLRYMNNEIEGNDSMFSTQKNNVRDDPENNYRISNPSAAEILEIEMNVTAGKDADVDLLATPKDGLVEELMDLSTKVDAKRAELEKMNFRAGERHAVLQQEITNAEKHRDELIEEVNHLKLKLHLLATDIKDDSSGGLRSIFRSYTRESEEDDSGQVEMKTIRSSALTRGDTDTADSGRIVNLENELEKERVKSKQLEKLNSKLTEQIRCFGNKQVCNVAGGSQPTEPLEMEGAKTSEVDETPQSKELQTLREENERLRLENNNLKTTLLGGVESNAEASGCKGGAHDNSANVAEEKIEGANMKDQCADSPGTVRSCDSMSSASTHYEIRSHAERMLNLVEQVIGQRSTKSLHEHARGLVSVDGAPPIGDKTDGETIVISNIDDIELQDSQCKCGSTEIFGKKEYVDFYLPKISITCVSCGKKKGVELSAGGDPCALGNILKEWQVEFLSSVNLFDTVDFIHACNQRRGILAKEMRQWRKDRNMSVMKTDSCAIALHVWSCTCKSVVKAVSEQKKNGAEELVRPDFMEIAVSDVGDQVVSCKHC